MFPCARRALLLLVAAEEARVCTVWGSGRCTTETADSDDFSAAGDGSYHLAQYTWASMCMSYEITWYLMHTNI